MEISQKQQVRPSVIVSMLIDYIDEPPRATHDYWQGTLTTGMPYQLHDVPFENEQQGPTLAFVAGWPESWSQQIRSPSVRLHSACGYSMVGNNGALEWIAYQYGNPLTIFNRQPSEDCDCEAQASYAFELMAIEGGIFFDLTEQEARNAGARTYEERLKIKREIYSLMFNEALTTYEACDRLEVPHDTRDYRHCAHWMLERLGLSRVVLLSNNPEKIKQLTEGGIDVTTIEYVPEVTTNNIDYLRSKQTVGGHRISRQLQP